MGKSGGGGNTTTVQKSDPWVGVQPFLSGNRNTNADGSGGNDGSGIYSQAQKLYQNQGWSPQMQSLADAQKQTVSNRTPGQVAQFNSLSQGLLGGEYDPNVQRVGSVNAQMVDPAQAFGSLGAANPAGSIQQMLSGQANTSALNPVVNNAMRRMGENFNEQVMPSINQGAVAAGQYGGSRQGIAQGLAAKGLAYSMGDTAANLYNNAFNTAQSNMYGTANNMAGLGLSNALSNANRDLTARTTNADISFRNNAQEAALAQQQLSNQMQGLNLGQSANQLGDQAYQQQMGLLDTGNQYDWNNLNRYASIIQPGSGIGGATSSQQNATASPMSGLIGGATLGAGAGSMMGAGAGLTGTAALGAFAPWALGGAVLGGLLR